ncbi:MAG: DUF948 domain-containing protein [Candidatus Kapabacteria bacterium]|nr:DUF948 domain-containing protein [Candidatus Kapabacteria bacterium]MBX7155991.1 DUF948 domain-containing protein [Bacteroidota bacterium]
METALYILGMISLVAFVALCIYAIKMLQRLTTMMDDVTSTMQETQKLAGELNKNLPTMFGNINTISQQLSGTMTKVDSQLDTLQSGLNEFKAIGVRVNSLEEKLQNKLEKPIMQAASVVSGITKAITTFTNGLKK